MEGKVCEDKQVKVNGTDWVETTFKILALITPFVVSVVTALKSRHSMKRRGRDRRKGKDRRTAVDPLNDEPERRQEPPK